MAGWGTIERVDELLESVVCGRQREVTREEMETILHDARAWRTITPTTGCSCDTCRRLSDG